MENQGMDAVLAKLGKKLGRKPMLKRKGLSDSSPMKESGMTVVIGMGKPSGAMSKRDEEPSPVKETSLEGLSAKLDAAMERISALEAKLNGEDTDEQDDESDMEEED